MPEFRYAKGRIAESLQFISAEIKEFENDYSSRTWDDYQKDKKLQKLIDRTAENILTALIEVSGTVVTQEGRAVENYAQILKECAKILGFSEEEQEGLAKLALQRNRLAHRYLNFRWQAIMSFVNQKSLILKLLKKIAERKES
jgi:uncharacterized protein YutE (UPF0331/DUF86 family)